VNARFIATVLSPRAWPDDPRAPGLTLAQAFVIFTRRRSPRLFAVALVALVIARLAVGGIGGWDLGLLLALAAIQPFSEWVIHVGILHWRPKRWLGINIDTYLSWSHREHHKKPHDERWWFIPLRSGIAGYVLIGGTAAMLMPSFGLWLTGVLSATVLAFIYEWTHYLCHTSYRPRSRWFQRLARHHRWHHFKNEHYWMGVSRHLGDWVLGTNPDVHEVETSPTCRDLLAETPPRHSHLD
jgi:hypothetical protein